MERSQSYTEFEAVSTNSTIAASSMQFRPMQQKSASGSNMNVKQPLLHTSVNGSYALNQTTNGMSLRRKRKMLQRQQSHEYADDDMDYEYAADQEDEDEEDLDLDEDLHASVEDGLTQNIVKQKPVQPGVLTPLLLKKHLTCQRRKQLIQALNCSNSLPNQGAAQLPMSINYGCCGFMEQQRRLKHEESFDSSSSTGIMSLGSPVSPHRQFHILQRDNSIHSDSSRYSSVDSLLEARKPDPEAILINLGFGPVGSEDVLSRIPKRFLKPSQVRGNDTEAFVRRLQLATSLADHSVLGYRGLTGNPDVPPSTIVAKIMRRFQVNERKKSMACIEHTIQ